MKKRANTSVWGLTLLAFSIAALARPQGLSESRTAAQRLRSEQPRSAASQGLPRFRFENFTTANGLPDNHVYAVLVDGDRIWAGTDNGLGLYESRQVEDLHYERWAGASRRAFAGTG